MFGEDEPIDYEVAYNHFASPVIQLRTLIVTWVHYVAHWVVWIVLGNTWAMIRSDQYDSHLNITVNFNRLMSDTEAFQSTLKYFGYSIIGTVLRFAVAKLGSPYPVPPTLPSSGVVGGRRDIDEEDIVGDFHVEGKSPPDIASGSHIKRREATGETFYESVLLPALNQNLQPRGITRNLMNGFIFSVAQTVFWLACALFPQDLPPEFFNFG